MALNLEQLLLPVSEDAPSGPDLAYDAARYEIEKAFETEVSIDSPGDEAKSSDVDWRTVIATIIEQSGQTKDIWLAVYLCRAGALSGALETVEMGAEYLAGLLEAYWPSVHPQLEEYGFQGRKGPCDSLVGLPQFISPLRRIPLLRHPRLGQFSGEDFERFRANGDAEEGIGMFRAALADVGQEGLTEAARCLDSIRAALKRADVVLTANAEDGGATNFQPTYDALKRMRAAVLAFGETPPSDEVADDADGSRSDTPSPGPRIAGRVDSRQDVIKALEAISDYYRRKEPAHPMIMLLQRSREWVDLDFMGILEDIAPGSIGEAKTVLQSRRARGE